MPVFWKGSRHKAQDGPRRERSRAVHPAGSLPRTACRPGILNGNGPGFEDGDWAEIDRLLGGEAVRPSSCEFDDTRVLLLLAVNRLRSHIDTPTLGAVTVMDQFLKIWGLARRIGPSAAKPAEDLLSLLPGRNVVTAREVKIACDRIEAACGRNSQRCQ
jgi:hypothetical protein